MVNSVFNDVLIHYTCITVLNMQEQLLYSGQPLVRVLDKSGLIMLHVLDQKQDSLTALQTP